MRNTAGIHTTFFREEQLKNVIDTTKIYIASVDTLVLNQVLASHSKKKIGSPSQSSRFTKQLVRWMIIGFVGAAAGVAIWMSLSSSQDGIIEQFKDKRVAVMVFENQTNSSDLETMGVWAADYITTQLMRLIGVEIVLLNNVQNNMNLSSAGNTTSRQFAKATGADVVINGRYYLQENKIIIHAHVVDAQMGTLIHTFETVEGDKGAPQGLLEALTQRILGYWSVKDLPAFNKRPPNYIAYQNYQEAIKWRGIDHERMKELLFTAFELDSTFYAALLRVLGPFLDEENFDALVPIFSKLSERYLEFTPWEKARYDQRRAEHNGDRLAIVNASMRMYEIDPLDNLSSYVAANAQVWSANNPKKAIDVLSSASYPYEGEIGSAGLINPYNPRPSLWMEALYTMAEYETMLECLDSLSGPNLFPVFVYMHLKALVRLNKIDALDHYVDHYQDQSIGWGGQIQHPGWLLWFICNEAVITENDDILQKYAPLLIEGTDSYPDSTINDLFRALGYFVLQDFEKSLSFGEKYRRNTLNMPLAQQLWGHGLVGACYARLNEVEKAEATVQAIEQLSTEHDYGETHYSQALIYANLNE